MRFTLTTLFTVIAIAAALLSLVGAMAEPGLLIALVAGGIALLIHGGTRRNRREAMAGAVFLLASIVMAPFLLVVAVGDGYRSILVVIVVVDQETGKAVTGATVQISADEFVADIVSGQTNAHGKLELVSGFPISSRSGLWSYSSSIYTGAHLVRIDAEGFERIKTLLDELIAEPWHPDTRRSPDVVVRLQPAHQNTQSANRQSQRTD